MIFKDYYKILEIDDNKVTMEDIKQAYREQAKKYHPDVNVEDKIAEEKFKDINEAYKVLENINTRKKYDRAWNANIGKKREKEQNKKDEMFTDLFSIFVGPRKRKNINMIEKKKQAMRGEDIETEIKVGIEEAFYGTEKKISLRAVNGKMKTFTIKIPAGIRDNEKVRLLEQGKPGTNGGRAGDLLIKIQIQDSNIYKLVGYDIHTDLLLSPWEAALGTKVPVQTIDDTITIYVPKGIESGEKVRIPGKGYKDGRGGRGDLVTTVKIMVPKNMSEEEVKLFQKLNEISKFEPRKQYIVNIN